jgi:signal transduction histidine kinase
VVPRQARARSTPSGAADGDLSARRLAVARTLADTVAGGLSAVIVETVAAQQALVRDAHPDDALLRMRAAEEHAHTATADLRRLLAATAVAEPAPAASGGALEPAER